MAGRAEPLGGVYAENADGHVESVRRHFIDLLSTEQIEALGDAADHVVLHLNSVDDPPRRSDSPGLELAS